MTDQLTKAVVAVAVVAVLGWGGPQAARAQRSYSGGWAGDTGFTWAEAFSFNPVTNPSGSRRSESFRPSYSGGIMSSSIYPSAVAPMSYYSATPMSGFVSSADYSYGASAPSAPAPGNTARIHLIVPADAQVWFGNTATRQTGPVCAFESPELTPGKGYTYEVKARWTENGKEMIRTRSVGVSANSSVTVDFTQQ